MVTIGARACAIPLGYVIETMRPLPIEAVSDVPAFVLGLSLVRGEPVPVVHAGLLTGSAEDLAPISRFVTVRAGDRTAALAVERVLGVLDLEEAGICDLPPLLAGAAATVEAVGSLDRRLILVLRAVGVVPDQVWRTLDARESRP